ncbi:cytochrome P450 [Actinoplanes siamensis]|uniref:Cytochrome P450 n=1 Tax=Actinoplanes siamensis TaxID=1223317 RepID=A0A919TJ38_9ACTN|nr:cytochrome P450 [Actinoplanes siamensis]GIF04179.1 cytochrome P450 [Actinoplanes siamensis]
MTQRQEAVRPDAGDGIVPRLPTERTCPFDPPEELRRLRAEAPVRRMRFPTGDLGWLLTGYDEVRALLADPRVSSRRTRASHPVRELPPEAEEIVRVQPGHFIAQDAPDHTRYRRLLTGHFTVRRVRALTGRIEEIVDDHLTAMAAGTPPVDLMQAFALPLPSLVICETLGVPYAERQMFQRRAAALISTTDDVTVIRRSQREMLEYMSDLLRAKRAEPGDDLLSGLVTRSDAEGPLTDEELVNIANLLLVAGHETTANMIAMGVLTLLRHPGQLAALCDDPDLTDRAVEELLRYVTIPQHGVVRTATGDIEIGGKRILAGETIVASLPAANRDPARFADPDTLDVSRQSPAHLSFGHGVHQCLGQQLARVEMRVAFRALLQRFPTLRLAVPFEQLRMRTDSFVLGIHELPVAWDTAAARA